MVEEVQGDYGHCLYFLAQHVEKRKKKRKRVKNDVFVVVFVVDLGVLVLVLVVVVRGGLLTIHDCDARQSHVRV